MKNTKIVLQLFLLWGGLFMACTNDFDTADETLQETIIAEAAIQEEVPEAIRQKLTQAGFYVDEGTFKFKEGYIVEGDIYLSEDHINELAANTKKGGSKTAHYVTNNLVTNFRTIRVYYSPVFSLSEQTNILDKGLRFYNELGLGIKFVRTNDAINNDIRISVANLANNNNNMGGIADSPQNGNPGRNVTLDISLVLDVNQRKTARAVFVHELGHSISFRHTDYQDRSFSCGGEFDNEGQTSEGANYVPGTPQGPVAGSWMNACIPTNVDHKFILADLIALYEVYGINSGLDFTLPFFRYFNATTGDHVYTTDYDILKEGAASYKTEGIQCLISRRQDLGTLPLYSYFNASSGDNFYTTNFNELGFGGAGYAPTGVVGFIYETNEFGTVPLYRYFNNTSGDHFYTTDFNELGNGRHGYKPEGVAGYVIPIKE